MKLRGGFRLAVAPRFHDRSSWSERLALNGGVVQDGSAFLPRADWRPPSAEELSLLIAATPAGGGDACLPADVAGLIVLPNHVRRTWWKAAEAAEALDGNVPGYERFVSQVVAFVRFKRLPLPEQCSFAVVASRPDQSSTRLDPQRCGLAGLTHSARSPSPLGPRLRTMAVINLGDEVTHVVLCNLPSEELHALAGKNREPGATEELVQAFFAACADYPLIRVRLDAGEGLWLPAAGAIYDGWTHGKQEADVVLTISTSDPSSRG